VPRGARSKLRKKQVKLNESAVTMMGETKTGSRQTNLYHTAVETMTKLNSRLTKLNPSALLRIVGTKLNTRQAKLKPNTVPRMTRLRRRPAKLTTDAAPMTTTSTVPVKPKKLDCAIQ
jgi:hypothetical protein